MKAKYIAIICLSALTFASCDFFESSSPSALEPKDVFSDATRTEQAIFAVYNLMGSNNSYRNRIACGFAGLNTDAEWSTQSLSSTAGARALVLYNCGVTNDRISNTNGSDIWSYLNTMIERSNNIIEGLEAYGNYEQNDTMAYFLGEALFLRSFAYLEMVKYWGDVPARFESIAKNPDGVKIPKSDRNLIYEQIRKDLKHAAELMPWSPEVVATNAKNNVGRANRAAALGLLARADLMYAGKAVRPGADGRNVQDETAYAVVYNIADGAERKAIYEEVLWACAQIINHEDYKLAKEFVEPFRQICMNVTAYSQMEHIWVMPFKDGARGQVLNYNAPKLSSDAAINVPGHLPGFGAGGSSNGSICVSPYLISRFEEGDARMKVTIVPGQWEYNDGTSESSNDTVRGYIFPRHGAAESKLYQKHTQANNFYLGKYRFEWFGEGGGLLTATDDGVDFPILRYADVLLMFAEAELGDKESGKPANTTGLSGLDQLNKVRMRAHLAELGTYSFEDIERERALELCGEYVRKYDLMRWGMLRQRMVDTQNFIRKMAADGTRHQLGYGDTLFYKYTWSEKIQGYEIDSLYGLHKGQTTRQPYMTRENGWQAKDIYNSDSKGFVLSENNYPIFEKEEQLETRQYWPIFQHNITAAGTDVLWNNYGYGQ